mmetsp:Transcript_10568/g.22381  ORF Transcript_10568/g.22381 Transcript_10568/m.22381 type:complete len:89 (+) Transcript_10568:315-581(+)
MGSRTSGVVFVCYDCFDVFYLHVWNSYETRCVVPSIREGRCRMRSLLSSGALNLRHMIAKCSANDMTGSAFESKLMRPQCRNANSCAS